MFGLSLDSNNDLHLDSRGGFATCSGPELVTQRLRIRLNRLLGEWFLDTSQGIDYLGEVFVKAPDLNVIRAMFVKEITATEGVVRLLELTLEQQVDRKLGLFFRVLTDSVILESHTEESEDGSLVLFFEAKSILGATI